jgi:hypothetical protein
LPELLDKEPRWLARTEKADPVDLSRLLSLGGERSEKPEGKDSDEHCAQDHHAATAVCWLSTAAIFRQPSIPRNRS